jgi:signal transduction histidine kinase
MAPLWETTAPFALFMSATVVAAWYAGTGPAILTGAIGLISRIYFDSPRATGLAWEETVRLVLYAGFVVGTAITLNRMREDRRNLEASILAARREIQERQIAEAALESARAAAEDANRLKDEFLTLVSHELRTPLNAILGWTALVKHGALPAERSSYALEVIQKNARLQSQLISDLLDIARGLNGQLRLEPTGLQLNTVVRKVVESARAAAEARRIRITPSIDPQPLPVWGDLDRLQQVVDNLLSNAIKFTPEGGEIEVLLRRRHTAAELIVRDSGDGIEPEFAPHLFEPFRQADSGATRRHGGLGLGLALVRQLVELHRGTVSAGRRPNGGAEFTVSLPLRESSDDLSDLRIS